MYCSLVGYFRATSGNTQYSISLASVVRLRFVLLAVVVAALATPMSLYADSNVSMFGRSRERYDREIMFESLSASAHSVTP
jgi:hypothetical protein